MKQFILKHPQREYNNDNNNITYLKWVACNPLSQREKFFTTRSTIKIKLKTKFKSKRKYYVLLLH